MPVARLFRCFALLRPGDGHAGLSWESHRAIRELLVGQKRAKRLETSVLARARLRDALGPERESARGELAEHVHRGMFCWWLHEHAAAIQAGETPQATTVPVIVDTPTTTASDTPLVLWSPERQIAWIQTFKGGLPTVRMLLRECLESRAFADLRGAAEDELGTSFASTKYLRTLLRVLRHLGLITEEDGRWQTTDDGEHTLENDPPERMIESLLVRVNGAALVLRSVQDAPLTQSEVTQALADHDRGPAQESRGRWLVLWLRMVGLLDRDGQHLLQTPLGKQWAARLPEVLPRPALSAVVDDPPDDPGGTDNAPAHPTFREIWARFQTDPALASFLFTREQVHSLHTAWTFHARKRFTILSGLSGTGKTQLLLQYGRVVCELMGLDANKHVALVPVRPDWRDPTGLLGYFNALHADPSFQVEPALRAVLRASRRPDLPWFLILDEMNLARVERYFAPFLSAMESGKRLHLHAEDGDVNGVPPSVPWPASLRIGGTVNMDETTHPFSDKVLDRAFTMELWDVDLKGFFGKTTPNPVAADAVMALQGELEKVRRHVGYRTAGEVVDWVGAALAADPDMPVDGLVDTAIYAKVLTRLRGAESPELIAAFPVLVQICTERNLVRCAAKLRTMQDRLVATGVTSFWS